MMQLQPTLVIILGDQWRVLEPRIKRWFELRIEEAFEVLAFSGDQEFREPVRQAMARLRAPSLIRNLEAGIPPKFQMFVNAPPRIFPSGQIWRSLTHFYSHPMA